MWSNMPLSYCRRCRPDDRKARDAIAAIQDIGGRYRKCQRRAGKPTQDCAGNSSNPFFPFVIHNFTIHSSPRIPPLCHNPWQSLPTGTPIMTVVWWGGTGASGGGLA
jgi:hypothetical protein